MGLDTVFMTIFLIVVLAIILYSYLEKKDKTLVDEYDKWMKKRIKESYYQEECPVCEKVTNHKRAVRYIDVTSCLECRVLRKTDYVTGSME